MRKSEFFKNSITYFGQIVDGIGIPPSQDKIQPILDQAAPCTKKQLWSFLEAVTYYRNYIKNFSELTITLNTLAEKSVPFVWTEKHANAFETVKKAMIGITFLSLPEPGKPYTLYVDAS